MSPAKMDEHGQVQSQHVMVSIQWWPNHSFFELKEIFDFKDVAAQTTTLFVRYLLFIEEYTTTLALQEMFRLAELGVQKLQLLRILMGFAKNVQSLQTSASVIRGSQVRYNVKNIFVSNFHSNNFKITCL